MKKHILLISAIAAVIGLTSCGKITGEGDNVEVKPSVSAFTSLDIEIPATVIITKASEASVKLQIQDNVYKNTDIYVKDGELNIEFNKNVKNHKQITIEIAMSSFEDLEFSGDSDVKIIDEFELNNDFTISTSGNSEVELQEKISCKNFEYEASGTSKILAAEILVSKDADMETSGNSTVTIDYIKADNLKVETSGTSNIELSGEAKSQDLESSGGMNYKALALETSNTKIKTSGNGDYEVAVSSFLDIDASGTTSIKYAGSPELELKQSGAFSLSKIK